MTTHHTDLSNDELGLFSDTPEYYERQKEIESTLLGMVVCGKEPKKGHIMECLCREMFVDPDNTELYDMIQDQYKRHGTKRLDPDFLINDYMGKKYRTGVFNALLALSHDYITDVNCDYYIKHLQENWLARSAKNCTSLKEFKKLEQLKEKYELSDSKSILKLNDPDFIAKFCNDYEAESESKSLKTGIKPVDNVIGNLQGGDFFILAGATGMGKTCIMLNFVLSMLKAGKKVLVFSLEMKKEQILNRMISAQNGIDASKYRNKNFNSKESDKYFGYLYSEEFLKFNIEICSQYNITTSKIRNIVNSSKPDVVFIDYLGLISGEGSSNSYERVSSISRELKLAAMEADIPFIVLHQLNRANTDRSDKRPMLTDLRDSGKIEQDADIIAFIFRPAYYSENADKGELQFIVSKNRHGVSGVSVKLHYDAQTQAIEWCKRESVNP